MNILIGNIISFIANIFTFCGSISVNKRNCFLYQVLQCFLLAAASIFFNSYAGVSTLLICAARNIFIAYDKYSNKTMCVFSVLTLLFGLISNNRGLIGLLPIIATLIYTISLAYVQNIIGVKWCMIVNSALWITYSIAILDMPTGITDSVMLITTTISLISLYRKNLVK